MNTCIITYHKEMNNDFLHVNSYIGNNVNNMRACMSTCEIKERHFKGFLNQFSVVQIFEEHGLKHRV